MKKTLLVQCVLVILISTHSAIFASPSKLIYTPACQTNEVDKLTQRWDANFCFPEMLVSLRYNEGEVTLTLTIENAALVTQEELGLLNYASNDGKESWCHEYIKPRLTQEADRTDLQQTHDFDGEYTIAPRHHYKDRQPARVINTDELAQLLHNKKILFYTGAGISNDGGVYMMGPLLKALMLDNYATIASNVINYSEQITEAFYDFCQTAFYNAPTPAHMSIAAMTQHYSVAVVTENFDFLHERSGITPYKIQSYLLRQEDPAILQEIDALVCVGLSYDDRGFIGWYKEHNPNGLLIAFDLLQPSYLNEDDYLVCGDLQKLLPELEQNLKHKPLIIGLRSEGCNFCIF